MGIWIAVLIILIVAGAGFAMMRRKKDSDLLSMKPPPRWDAGASSHSGGSNGGSSPPPRWDADNSAPAQSASVDAVQAAEQKKHAAKEQVLLSSYEDARKARLDFEKKNPNSQSPELASLKQAEGRAFDLLENSRFTTTEMQLENKLASWRAGGKNKEDLLQMIQQTRDDIAREDKAAEQSTEPKHKQWHQRHQMHHQQILSTLEELHAG